MTEPTVAIVGRPNVGKSTIFNRLVGRRISIVEDTPGVTRDRIYAHASWLGTHFNIIDTGGIDISKVPFMQEITTQAKIAMQEADVIIFMVDGREQITAADSKIAKLLYHSKKPVILAVNKIDNMQMKDHIYDFYSLGFGTPYPISGTHSRGLGDLLDAVLKDFPAKMPETSSDEIHFCLIGRPNVGKSSIINAILGQKRVIVSHIAGTTRDAINTHFQQNGTKFTAVDTAGLRRKSKVLDQTERYSDLRAMRAIDNSDVAIVVLNGMEGMRKDDERIAGYAHNAGKGVIVAVNKCDLVKKHHATSEHNFREAFYREFKYLTNAPILFVSAKTDTNLDQLVKMVKAVHKHHNYRIKSSTLNDVVANAVAITPTPSFKGRHLRVYYATQVTTAPPTFVFFVNDPALMHFSYERYLENQIRQHFNLIGTPLKCIARRRS